MVQYERNNGLQQRSQPGARAENGHLSADYYGFAFPQASPSATIPARRKATIGKIIRVPGRRITALRNDKNCH